jgi:hypothetical protein
MWDGKYKGKRRNNGSGIREGKEYTKRWERPKKEIKYGSKKGRAEIKKQ